MNISKTVKGTSLLIAPEGSLDTVSAPILDAVLKESLPGMTELTLDMEKVEYISSTGLRVLISAQKAMKKQQGILTVIGVNDAVMEIFYITGLSSIFNIQRL